jgi:hypothetical protein
MVTADLGADAVQAVSGAVTAGVAHVLPAFTSDPMGATAGPTDKS